MLLIDTTPTAYSNSRAEWVARELQRGDPEWTYRVKPLTGGKYSYVAIYDEHGDFISYFTGGA